MPGPAQGGLPAMRAGRRTAAGARDPGLRLPGPPFDRGRPGLHTVEIQVRASGWPWRATLACRVAA
jgi:hypothetical protein